MIKFLVGVVIGVAIAPVAKTSSPFVLRYIPGRVTNAYYVLRYDTPLDYENK